MTTTVDRHELKYVLTEQQAAQLRHFVAPWVDADPYTHRGLGRYRISSLYLDAANLLLQRQTIDGIRTRFKLRVRCYTDAAAVPVFLEVKHRRNGVISKTRAPIARADLKEILVGATPDGSAHAAHEEFVRRLRQIDARPTVLVRYFREAYVGHDDPRTRVTFDRELMSAATRRGDVRCGGGGWNPILGPAVLLELKFSGLCPRWMAEAVDRFELRRQSYSKYANAVANEQRHGVEIGS